MLRWLSLALTLAASRATFADPSLESKEPGDALDQCQGRAWVRAPDMVPGDVIAGDVKVKLIGPCANAESYALGLRYKERIFWKLRQQDAPLPKTPEVKYEHTIPANSNSDLFQVRVPGSNAPEYKYNKTEWMAYQESFENKDLWTVHEEERVAFEIKTTIVSAVGADTLPTSFTTRFGILVPNTNYPPGVDYRQGGVHHSLRETDTISGESIYEYFVEIKFSNGTTSEIPAGITAFDPVYLSTENDYPRRVNVLLTRTRMQPVPVLEAPVDNLQSNYMVEIYFPNGTQVYQNSSVNMMATVHRTGYTNRTDTPVLLCGFQGGPSPIEWLPQGLKDRSQDGSQLAQFTRALVPSKQNSPMFQSYPPFSSSPCREIKFAAIPVDLTQEGHISSTSSEPISLSVHVERNAIPNFSTYYQKFEYRTTLNLHIKPDPSEPWDKNEFQMHPWGTQSAEMDETDFDWVPWSPVTQTRRVFHQGRVNLSVIPVQQQGHLLFTPVHYLSDEAREPVFVQFSDIADLRLMSPEERDAIAPLAQTSIKVFSKGEELRLRYFTSRDMRQQPIYVGDTWVNKVLSVAAEGRDNMDHLLIVQ
ncbi:hypothetical protein AZE42_10939 [Rhizopogon vesiculosus]|uniref:Arrestin-like N-terminal domain-containing protein n=1 Tax=Rhizopogon vesiculosus TaxID=180088 RepID=A0A1J8PKX1_9AGAM|nr:hypothetical protein AZE42_10939 [Rhizopogon vesiculosus]